MAKTIIFSDLHLVDKVSEQYRFEVFDVVLAAIEAESQPVHIACLGDLSDAKDNHSATLVNKIFNAFYSLSNHPRVLSIGILAGNHDYPDTVKNSFWRFLGAIPKVFYVTEIMVVGDTIWLPNSRDTDKDWQNVDWGLYKRAYVHQAYIGALVSAGYGMRTGINANISKRLAAGGKMFAGDIHVPAEAAGSRYVSVGAPCRLRFGDAYEPRIIIVDEDNNYTSIPTGIIEKEKVTVTSIKDLKNINKNLRSAVFIDSEYSDAILAKILADTSGAEFGVIERFTVLNERTTIITEQDTSAADGTAHEKPLLFQWNAFCEVTKVKESVQYIGRNLLEELDD